MPPLIDQLGSRAYPTAGRFLLWWREELAALVPSALMRTPGGRAANVFPGRSGVEVVRVVDGEGERLFDKAPLEAFTNESWLELGRLLEGCDARIILRPPLIYQFTLKLPKAARAHLRSTIPLQLRDHSPVVPELVDWTIIDVGTEGEKIAVQIVLAHKATLALIERGFTDHELPLPPIYAELAEGQTVRLRRGSGPARTAFGSVAPPYRIAAAMLLLAPFLILLILHLMVLHERQAVADLEIGAQPAIAAERHLRSTAKVATAVKQVLIGPAVMTTIDDLADRVPSNAHATEVSAGNGKLAFTLETSAPELIRRALAADTRLPRLRQLDQASTTSGTYLVHYEAGRR